MQYVEHRVTFSYHQPDAELIKGGKVYDISHLQAHTARQDYNGATHKRTLTYYIIVIGLFGIFAMKGCTEPAHIAFCDTWKAFRDIFSSFFYHGVLYLRCIIIW